MLHSATTGVDTSSGGPLDRRKLEIIDTFMNVGMALIVPKETDKHLTKVCRQYRRSPVSVVHRWKGF